MGDNVVAVAAKVTSGDFVWHAFSTHVHMLLNVTVQIVLSVVFSHTDGCASTGAYVAAVLGLVVALVGDSAGVVGDTVVSGTD